MTRDQRGNVLMIFAFSLIPLMATVGAAVDYSQAARSRSHMLEAANAAALAAARAAQSYMNQNGNVSSSWTQAQVLGQAQYSQVFTANEASDTRAQTVAPGLAMVLNADGSVSATVTATATVPTTFMRLVGIYTVPISSVAQATGGGKIYYQIVFLVDVSNSMAIGGDAATIAQLQADSRFNSPGTCAFACHDPNSTETNKPTSYYCHNNPSNINCAGGNVSKQTCTTFFGYQYCTTSQVYQAGSLTYCPATSQTASPIDCVMWDDKRMLAKYLGYQLKIDAVNSAIQTFVSGLQTPMTAAPTQYQISIWTFASAGKQTKIFPNVASGPLPTAANISTYYSQLQSVSQAIDIEPATTVTMPFNHGYTYTSDAFTSALLDAKATLGNGADTLHRKTFFILLTDGAEDIVGTTYANRQVVVNYKAVCDTIKATTVNGDTSSAPNIYSIEATYPSIPGDSQYAALISNTGMDTGITSAMQYCASPGAYLSASNNADIATDVAQVFSAITAGNLRLTK
jgi:Flp pilus assembly protein TadG